MPKLKLKILTTILNIFIWNQVSYNEDGNAYGRVSFYYGNENYALLEIIDQKGTSVISYKLDSR